MSGKIITGWWNGEPITRDKTPRESLMECAENEGQIKSLNFVADVIERKEGIVYPSSVFENEGVEDLELESLRTEEKNEKENH